MDLVVEKPSLITMEELVHGITAIAGPGRVPGMRHETLGHLVEQAPVVVLHLAELEEDLVSIDALIGLAESEMGQKIFGDNAKNVAEEGRKAKAAGAKNCFCDACKAVEAILSKKEEMLA